MFDTRLILADGGDDELPAGALLVEPQEVLALLDARIAKLETSTTSQLSNTAPKSPDNSPCRTLGQHPNFERISDPDLAATRLTVPNDNDETEKQETGVTGSCGAVATGHAAHSRYCER